MSLSLVLSSVKPFWPESMYVDQGSTHTTNILRGESIYYDVVCLNCVKTLKLAKTNQCRQNSEGRPILCLLIVWYPLEGMMTALFPLVINSIGQLLVKVVLMMSALVAVRTCF